MRNIFTRRIPIAVGDLVCIVSTLLLIIFLVRGVVPVPAADPTETTRLPPTHYDILGVSIDVSNADLKRVYLHSVKAYHPDKVQRLGIREREAAKEKFETLRLSYEFLLSDERCKYDALHMRPTLAQQSQCLRREVERQLESWTHELINRDREEDAEWAARQEEYESEQEAAAAAAAAATEAKDHQQGAEEAMEKFGETQPSDLNSSLSWSSSLIRRLHLLSRPVRRLLSAIVCSSGGRLFGLVHPGRSIIC